MRNHSYENVFDLHENETACRTHFHMKGFALRFALKQRHKRTQKWPIIRFCPKLFFSTSNSEKTCNEITFDSRMSNVVDDRKSETD